MFANLEWFKDQAERQYQLVPVGDVKVRVQSLTVLEQAEVTAAALEHAKTGDKVDTPKFARRQLIVMVAKSIVDDKGVRVFQDTDEHYAIVEQMRSKSGKALEDAVRALSMPDNEATETKNSPAVPG